MLFYVRFIHKRLFAVGTLKRPLPVMRPNVLLKLVVRKVRLWAEVAEELLDPFRNLNVADPVDLSHVHVQRLPIFVPLHAQVTLESDNVRVGFDVPRQHGPVDALPLAQVAGVVLLARVGLHVGV